MNLNDRASELVERVVATRALLRVVVHERRDGGRTIDFGIAAAGGLEAGRLLAEICMAALGQVTFVPADSAAATPLTVQVTTDHPVAACMAAQYAGWRIAGEKFFAMGSGPMRAAAGSETLFDRLGHRESATRAVGVLESRQLPPEEIVGDLARQCCVPAEMLTLLVAPTASLAGTVQIVARSVETALHKLFEIGFDLHRVVSGAGRAPLPPAAKNDPAAIGRTNDAILYGGEVTLWVRGDDASLEEIGPRVPSSASAEHGEPFLTLFERAGRDFYRMDPHLFSPAVVTFINLDTGRSLRYGALAPHVLARSFES